MVKLFDYIGEKLTTIQLGPSSNNRIEISTSLLEESGLDEETLKYYTDFKFWGAYLAPTLYRVQQSSEYSSLDLKEQIIIAVKELATLNGNLYDLYINKYEGVMLNSQLLKIYSISEVTLTKYLFTALGTLRIEEKLSSRNIGKSVKEIAQGPTPEELLEIIQQLEAESPLE